MTPADDPAGDVSADAVEKARGEAAPTGAAPRPPKTRKSLVYHVGLAFCWVLVRLWHRSRIRGAEHLPAEGGYLLVSNHQSATDIPLLGIAIRRHGAFVYRETLRRSRFMAWFTDQCGGIPIRRGAPDREALRAMRAHLTAGDIVVVFPEGTRSRDGSLGAFGTGVLAAARKVGVPLVPAGIRGACDAWPRDQALPRPWRVSLDIGPPIDPRAPDAAEQLREAIVSLVGDGRYAGGPAPPEGQGLPSAGRRR